MSNKARKLVTHLDPHDPFVIDTGVLGRRPGAMHRTTEVVPAPEGFGLDMVGVPAGARVTLDLRLEAVMEGVLVSGTVSAPLRGECSRCLDSFESRIETEFQELFAYPESEVTEDDALPMDGDFIDLQTPLRDAVLLALPLSPLCREGCPGLCPECGVRLDEVGASHHHEHVDPRWSALQGFFEENEKGDTTEEDRSGGSETA